ncbi:MAG: PAAR-like protein [Clostridiaceae bacterium]|nr:PAAR-like protein [Clostridiaceae bacterium]
MGWIDWSWWMKEEEKPAEPLVLGAELECEYGSQRSFLMVETDGISINDLPKACVEDSIAHRNIHPFGKCLKNDECYFKMDLEERWVNAEPQTERVNGKEIITTSSTLICKASGMAIRAVTSGQDGRFARFQQFLRNMERKYPGLRETLEDPYGSVYLEGNYEMALQFLEEQIEGREEGLEIVTLYDPKNLEGAYILAALERLMTDCEVRSFEGFMNDLRDTANQHGMQGKEGWDQNYLNEAMMELLRKDCKETAERIETNPVYRGIEKQKMFGSWLRECTEAFAYTTVMYSSALAEGNSSGRRMEGDKGRGAVKKGEEKGKESGSVKGSSEMGGERVDGKGGSKSGTETDLFLPDEFYNKNLPNQVAPGTKYLPKYDELGNVKQIKMYDDYGREIGWVDYTNHGYGDINSPHYHTTPHWHEKIYNAQYPDGIKTNHRTDVNTPLGDK